ncbi:hypothetical protein KP509_18G074800 [Ceratopteris richardii]|uniref:Uncharacterized protein n=1 Tax=Ceratopteris richardii TaxID=49495 RepID=A0A8T2SRM6_CERRI|nr:hypothetical protein KP509_18G074800 [Ceratopteris richardii]
MAPTFHVLSHRSAFSRTPYLIHKFFGLVTTKNLQNGFSSTKTLSFCVPSARRELGLLYIAADWKAEEPLPSEMSKESALRILGVSEGDSFEEIIRAKSSLLTKHGGDSEFSLQVEAAYDVLLMGSLIKRKLGKVVDSSILYADVKKTNSFSGVGGVQWLTEVISSVPVAVEAPTLTDFGTRSAVFAGLTIYSFASGISSDSSLNQSDAPHVVLAIGVGASIYFLRQKNVNFGKAVMLTVAALAAGSVLGGAFQSWLRVDLVPIFGVHSPSVIVSEFVLVSLWISSLCLH